MERFIGDAKGENDDDDDDEEDDDDNNDLKKQGSDDGNFGSVKDPGLTSPDTLVAEKSPWWLNTMEKSKHVQNLGRQNKSHQNMPKPNFVRNGEAAAWGIRVSVVTVSGLPSCPTENAQRNIADKLPKGAVVPVC